MGFLMASGNLQLPMQIMKLKKHSAHAGPSTEVGEQAPSNQGPQLHTNGTIGPRGICQSPYGTQGTQGIHQALSVGSHLGVPLL